MREIPHPQSSPFVQADTNTGFRLQYLKAVSPVILTISMDYGTLWYRSPMPAAADDPILNPWNVSCIMINCADSKDSF